MQFLKTTTIAAGPTPLRDSITTTRKFSVIACNGLDGPSASANSDTVKIGLSGAADEQPWELAPGDERSFENVNGVYDLSKIFITVAADGDGVVVVFQ